MWEKGSGITGRDIDGTVARALSFGKITPEQAKQYWDRITSKDFPNAKAAIDSIPQIASALTGIDKKKAKADDLLRLSSMESSLSSLLRKKLDQQGGALSAEQINAFMEDVKIAASANELSNVKKPFDFGGLIKNTDEKAVAKTKAALDSPSGDTIIGTDVNDKMVIVGAQPENIRTALETVSKWEVGNLKSRFGVDVAATRQMPSPVDERDITGSRIYTGTDGKQYMYLSKGDKMEAYARDTPDSAWKPAKQKEEWNTGFDVRYPIPTGIDINGNKVEVKMIGSMPTFGGSSIVPMSPEAWNKKTLKEKQEIYAKNNIKAVNP
jgi:hypothetical protein